MVTHEAPLDTYLNRLIAAVEHLADQVEELTIVVNNANTNRSQEAEALGERNATALETLAEYAEHIYSHMEDNA